MAYEIQLGEIVFPVPPEKLEIKIGGQNETMTLISGQEINIPKYRGLRELSLSLLLPTARYPFASYPDGFKGPTYYREELKKIIEGRAPVQLQITRRRPGGEELFHDNFPVLIESLTYAESAGSFDLTANLDLKEYIPYGTVIAKPTGEENQYNVEETRATENKPETAPYTVVKGDTLWGICKRFLGNGALYPQIAKLNGIKNPNLIYPGQVIRFE